MTREEIDNLYTIRPFCFETDREETWFYCGLVEGADIADKAMIEKACDWLKENITNDPSRGFSATKYDIISKGELIEYFKQAMEE